MRESLKRWTKGIEAVLELVPDASFAVLYTKNLTHETAIPWQDEQLRSMPTSISFLNVAEYLLVKGREAMSKKECR